MRVFLAGASGAVGRRLTPLLLAEGHEVFGTTRSSGNAGAIEALGAAAVIVDVYDPDALTGAMHSARPDVVIHQLTDLPRTFDPDMLAAAAARNARLRREGTANLVAAALAAGARRIVAQSICFIYAPGRAPHLENDPLDAAVHQRTTVGGVEALERLVTRTPGLDGLVLRYGRLYGPGTWRTEPGEAPTVHVDAAAAAALRAAAKGEPGIYNIADDDGTVSIEKARRELGFDPAFRAA